MQTRSRLALLSRSLRNTVAVAATVVLALGGSVLSAATAHAAPTDPVVFHDQALEDAVNAELGQNPGDTITEAQAAGVTSLDANNAGITSLDGIEYFIGLEYLNLDDNSITSLAPLVGLSDLEYLSLYENGITDASSLSAMTNLRRLYLDYNSITNLAPFASMTGLTDLSLTENGISDISQLAGMTWLTDIYLDDNNISDISPLATMTGLESLVLYNNQIADISLLSGLTKLEGLHLSENNVSDLSPLSSLPALKGLDFEDNLITDLSPLTSIPTLVAITAAQNRITDVSPLSSMPGLTYATLGDQKVTMPVAAPGIATPNPVRDRNGNPVAVSAIEPDFTFDAAANTWAFTGSGGKTLEWNTTIAVGGYDELPFTGTIVQEISPLVTLQDPVVTQAVCVDGRVTAPRVTLPTTEGVIYTLVGDVAAGTTVTINAEAVEGRVLVPAPDSNWSTDSDGMTGALLVTLDTVDCDALPTEPNEGGTKPAVPNGEVGKPAVPNGQVLARTGADSSAVMLGALGALLALAGAALVAVRRRMATR